MKRRREAPTTTSGNPAAAQSSSEKGEALESTTTKTNDGLDAVQPGQLKRYRVDESGSVEASNSAQSVEETTTTTTTTTTAPDKLKVGDVAPDFTADAVADGEFTSLSLAQYRGRYVVLVFYPLDFTFVCPTELIAVNNNALALASINCVPLAISVDSKYTHLAWLNTPASQGGLLNAIGGAPGGRFYIPLISDLTQSISRSYGLLDEHEGHSKRAVVIISDKGIVRSIIDNEAGVGRSTSEIMRIVQAFQYIDSNPEEACPIEWTPGGPTIVAKPRESKAYFEADHMST